MDVHMVACPNGLGHVKRLMVVALELLRRAPEASLTLHAATWQMQALQSWRTWQRLYQDGRTDVRALHCPVVWHGDASSYGPELLTWQESLDLRGADRVVSDGLVEPLYQRPDAALVGSFLWHDVLAKAHPQARAIAQYSGKCETLLERIRPLMVVSEEFAMPETHRLTRSIGVGLTPLVDPAAPRRRVPSGRKRVLVALGSSSAAAASLKVLVRSSQTLGRAGVTLVAPPDRADQLRAAGALVEAKPFLEETLLDVEAAIIRAGMGSLSDAIAARTPVFTIPDSNPEIQYNARRLQELGCGAPLEHLLMNPEAALAPEALSATAEVMARLDINGAEATASTILDHWGRF